MTQPTTKRLTVLLTVLLSIAVLPAAVAQERVVDATIVVSPVETLRLSDFDPTDPGAAPTIFTITVRADDVPRMLRARVSVIGERSGLLGVASANIGSVPPRATVVITNRDFDSYDLADAASDVIDFASERGVLPPDNYSFQLLVLDESDNVLGEDEDFTITAFGGGEIFSLTPGVPLGDSPEMIDSPQPVFMWQSDGSLFDFTLYEVVDAGAAADDIASGLPVFSVESVDQTTLAYPSYAEALRPGATYAWLVESVIETPVGSERIPSEMLWFTIRSTTGDERVVSVPGLARLEVTPQEETLTPSGVLQLQAEGFDSNGESLGPVDVAWDVVPASGGEVTATGLFTASALSGVVAVVAEKDDLSDFSTITVTRGRRGPSSRDSAYVVMLSPSDAQVLMEPAPSFSWQVMGADSSGRRGFRLSLATINEENGSEQPLWSLDVGDVSSVAYPVSQPPLESGNRYLASVAVLDSAGVPGAASDPVEFALDRDPKISWELYNAWDEAQRANADTVRVTMLVLMATEELTTALRDQIAALGGTIEIAEGPWLQLAVPFSGLQGLASISDIRMMTLPSPHVLFHPAEALEELGDASSGAKQRNADAPDGHVTGLFESRDKFAPIDVAIFEFGFNRNAVAEIIDPTRVRYHTFRRDSRIEGTGGADALHGVATLKAMAEYLPPTATVHLINFDTEPEFQQALRFAVEELNARVITCSVSWANAYDDYDGTSFFSQAIQETLGEQAALVVAAGNFAQSHWEALFNDTDGDGGHNFADGTSYLELELNSAARYDFLLSWDEWGNPNRDLDIEILDERGEPLFDRYGRPIASRNKQSDGQYVEPLERIRAFRPPFAGKQTYRVRIVSATPDETDQNPPQFELYVYPPPGGSNPNPDASSSLASGIATTRSSSVIPVGAAGFVHSSRGPTNDGRVRPDFSTSGTLELNNRRFQGTSFATPRVAAALGSVLSRHPDWTLEQAIEYLKQFVATESPEGKDNVLGWGTLDLESVVRSL